MPAGFGVMGSAAIFQLQGLNLTLAQSVAVVSVVRLTTTGVVIAAGVFFFVRELFIIRKSRRIQKKDHFDKIAPEYLAQFSNHIWSYLLKRKTRMIVASLQNPYTNLKFGLDLGCGLGNQCREMEKYGYTVIGLDSSLQLLREAHESGATVISGDALSLPFADNSFDFVYAVGVLHHINNVNSKKVVNKEILRVLKPEGRFIVIETNPRNPLFRFYMGYIFPLLASIDQGIERWITTDIWENIDGMELVDVTYFTFIPDFIPNFLMRFFLSLERWLEATPLRSFSVHYMAVLQKES
jgi:ubiquinone/menaquinone biosynthesis C-methylase UbiE